METKIFDGKAEAQKIKEILKKEAQKEGLVPSLSVVLVGNNLSSAAYIKQKQKACEALDWGFTLHHLSENSSFKEIKKQLLTLNSQPSTHGVILQLPLPISLRVPSYELTSYILPTKDIDGLTLASLFTPPTALAAQFVLTHEEIPITGAKVVVLGRGPTSGRPIADLLFKRGAQIYVIHSQTPPSDAISHMQQADIVVSCVGKPQLVRGEMIKEGVVVIGVGMSRLPESESARRADSGSRVVGDLDEPSLLGKARLITPTPGGIGPLTVAFLLKNLLRAAQLAANPSVQN